MIRSYLGICIVLLSACRPNAETIDVLTGDYFGELQEADLLTSVDITRKGTSLDLAFYEHDGALWADARFNGHIQKGILALEGPETDTVEGVTVDGDILDCVYRVNGVALKVTGTFSLKRSVLRIVIDQVGTVQLVRVDEDDTGDAEGVEVVPGDTGV